ncbi:hypothetical protein BD780_002714 [Clostridium tetanomorphum]|uniref:YiiG family protein n=1 Tax=Clostridium tetanomorphum TaxID=1553 RepID=A0A923J1A1_CLOTT|nr:YiiG family protein [Clostridium tetanomorphum]KAJ50596.1 membrane associated protein [Clostridium tetanomorphum DSM 665]MBC2399056.1 YiiG family protein [Clostridium tetanomorphum]MBP1862671.1 hypothetical protein [Clostridium tetanomorphum]NRS85489.1 hypothetical protein [Clostridium tetanomorphum]NRZ98603.1 hypothetical protein [Clostridium tetanomorphum]
MLKKILSSISICVAMCLLLTSCGSADKSKAVSSQEDTKKYNNYVTLSNYMTGWLDTALATYFNKFGIENEIIIKKGFDGFNGVPILDAHKNDLDKALEYASKKPSYGETDAKIKVLHPKMKELMNTLGEIQSYYKSKGFIDDKFAKGKELHKKVCAQYKEYDALAEKFFTSFDTITEQKKKEDLDKLKKNDMMIRYYAMSILNRAQDIEMSFYKAKINDNNILNYDVNKYKEKYDLLTEDINKFIEYSKDDERRKKEKIAIIPTFSSDVKRVKVTATDIMEVLKTKDTTINSTTKGKVTTGGKNALLHEFSRIVSNMVDSYNNMINTKVVD